MRGQDVSLWKDLGPKFILQVYRDYLVTQTPWFLADLYPVALQGLCPNSFTQILTRDSHDQDP